MGCLLSKQSSSQQEIIQSLQHQIDSLQENLEKQNKDAMLPSATAVPIVAVVVEDCQDDTSKPPPSAPPPLPLVSPAMHGSSISVSACWDYVDGGDIRVGPGLCWDDDPNITLENESITEERHASEWLSKYESSDNPIVMWQIVYHEGVPRLWAHRLHFMYQHLDANTGGSPKGFATSTKDFLCNTPGKRGRIYVRNDQWWQAHNGGNGAMGNGGADTKS